MSEQPSTKVLFLDIDGVLNTQKTVLLYGTVYARTPRAAKLLDPYASVFLQRLTQHGIQIVLSSTWRLGIRSPKELAEVFDFPVCDVTPSWLFPQAIRGDEVQAWLDEPPQTTHYCIVDDDCDFLSHQLPFFVQTQDQEGLTFAAMTQICKVLGFDIWELIRYRCESAHNASAL